MSHEEMKIAQNDETPRHIQDHALRLYKDAQTLQGDINDNNDGRGYDRYDYSNQKRYVCSYQIYANKMMGKDLDYFGNTFDYTPKAVTHAPTCDKFNA